MTLPLRDKRSAAITAAAAGVVVVGRSSAAADGPRPPLPNARREQRRPQGCDGGGPVVCACARVRARVCVRARACVRACACACACACVQGGRVSAWVRLLGSVRPSATACCCAAVCAHGVMRGNEPGRRRICGCMCVRRGGGELGEGGARTRARATLPGRGRQKCTNAL